MLRRSSGPGSTRQGIRVMRRYQMARSTDGTANRKQVGRGEGSSGLRFDSVD
jgi:hypothetical protein